MNVLHGLTGSVASRIVHKFEESYSNDVVKFVLSQSAKQFNPPYYSIWKILNKEQEKAENFPSHLHWESFDDSAEWEVYKQYNSVLHIDLVKWADCLLIAPCSANTLAKIANGICDNLLTNVARAWDFDKPFVIAPSMNDKMYSHPITEQHLNTVKSWGITIVPPQSKKLFCGDYGLGAMADIQDIVKILKPV